MTATIRIRDEQRRAFERVGLRRFVVEMMAHLRRHFGAELASMADWELGETIERCVLRAADYGLTSRRDCARFLGLATCFGWSFDEDLAWPATALRDATTSPSARLARVHERCLRLLQQEAEKSALRRSLAGRP